MDLKEMLQRTKESLKENAIIEKLQVKQEVEKVEARTTTEYDIDSREVKMILSLGLRIDKFTPQDPNGNYYDAEEYYYCSNDKWDVKIRNLLYDADLGTILQVLELTNKADGQVVDFYCDLWSRNTTDNRLRQFKFLVTHTYDEYIIEEFGIYFTLPKLLRDKGFDVIENDFTFNSIGCIGNLEISNPNKPKIKSYLRISHDWNISVSLSSILKENILNKNNGYSVKYNSEKDIDTLVQVINKHLEHIEGKIGFLEDGRYYDNKNIERLFDAYERKFDHVTDMSDSYKYKYWNISEYEDRKPTQEETDEYNRISKIANINHYNGAEIYKLYEMSINYDAYHFGGVGTHYEFEIIYNLNIDKDNCILNVKQITTEYVGRNNVLNDDNLENEVKEETNTYSVKGTFTYIEDTLTEFLDELSKISETEE
jgi:hypothetical protein